MDRHRRATELFLACCEMAAEERAAFLVERCGDDLALIEQVEGMIAFEERRPEFLAASAGQGALTAHGDELPASIGPFRILRKLGQGGMGAVYEAQQERPHRTVALKVLRPFLAALDALRRFEHEGEFLARLQHPGIAQIFDSGSADTERGPLPYFALELVRGDPLTVHARKQHLSPRKRLELLARVADAVQHAHQHGVIHRDLKPANILVDESGQPKVLDFGIARASDSDVQLATQQTDVGQILGTLAYMSPEQTSGDPARIDTRSDVYSLGVLLYELLADRLPYDVSGKSLPEAVRVIQEEAPSRLGAVDSAHRGDLETIVRTALEKDKERRYASAEALAADVRRYLRHEPIAARPPSRIYTLSMLVRRNKALTASLGAAVLVLVAGLIVSLVLRARAERRTDEVLRLSALQVLEDLILEADRLWPPHPELIDDYRTWIEDAGKLVADLPVHRAKRAELRALARQRTREERRMEREAHRDSALLEMLEVEIERQERRLARRQGEGVVDATGEGGRFPVSEDAAGLVARAEALFTEGLDDDARYEADAAINVADEDEKAIIEAIYADLERRSTEAMSEEGITRAEQELAALEQARLTLDERIDEQREWPFPDEMEGARWWNNQLTKLIEGTEALTAPATGLLGVDAISDGHGWSVPRRLALAEKLAVAFAPGGEYDERWQAALPRVAEDYPGLELQIQMGLVPLGKDSDSGLWEFWHVQSGAEPARDKGGKLQPTAETGLVLVLLRGGRFIMGSVRDPAQPNRTSTTMVDEAPAHEVELSPFFFSKYELTQAQWMRLAARNPSFWSPDYRPGFAPIQLTHPVESVSWYESRRVLGWSGMELPSEAQWEYGARGGTRSSFACPDEELGTLANLADQAHGRVWALIGRALEPWDDGFGWHAPVGSLEANAFGLHDVHGNVWEHCLDGYEEDFYARSPRVDPVAPWQYAARTVLRGGAYTVDAKTARSATRNTDPPSSATSTCGVRPARAIDAP